MNMLLGKKSCPTTDLMGLVKSYLTVALVVAPSKWSVHEMNDQPTNADFDQLLTVKQVAKRAAISGASVWRLSKSGDLPQPVRIGRSVRWRTSDLQNHIESRV